jgi:hypothetical protein
MGLVSNAGDSGCVREGEDTVVAMEGHFWFVREVVVVAFFTR